MPIANKRAPQDEVSPIDISIEATSIPVDGEETISPTPSATATVREVPTLTQSISASDITPTTTSQSLSSGLFTVLSQMTLAPSSSLPAPSVSGTVIRPVSSSIRPTVIVPASASSVNSVPNGLLMFTFMVILFMRFFKH